MGFARSLSVPCLVISWLSVATVNVAAQLELSGTVVDASGSALPRVAVTLVDQRDVEIATTFTDSRGVFRFAHPCERCAVTVSLSGFNATRTAVSIDNPAIVTLSVGSISLEAIEELESRGVDPCGELGEYHTLVTSTPLFSSPLEIAFGARELHSDCWALDVHVGAGSVASG
jgi:hypothetical protein